MADKMRLSVIGRGVLPVACRSIPVIALALSLVTPTLLRATGQDRQPSSTSVTFQEMTFEIPGSDWSRQETARQINLARVVDPGHSQALGVWPVIFPPSLGARTPQDHTTAIFDFERHKSRPPGTRWEGFVEGTRTIAGSSFPTMTYTIHEAGGGASGLFLLYFPADFQTRQRFYCLMYQDTRRASAGAPKLDLGTLDSIVSSFHVAAVSPPPSRLTLAKAGEGLLAPTYASQIEQLLKISESTVLNQTTEPSADLKRVAVRCAEQLEKQPSYSSHVQLVDKSVAALEARNYVIATWTFDHQAPNNYHVTQTSWNGKAYDYDEWITVGQTHFDFVGFWIQPSTSARIERIDLNTKLGLQKFSQVLRDEEPQSGGAQSVDGRRYTSVRYLLSSEFKGFLGKSDGPMQVDVWIESETGLLAKARVTPAGSSAARFQQQVFVGYGGNVQIQAPSQVLKPK
jgi:hypothetical protein